MSGETLEGMLPFELRGQTGGAFVTPLTMSAEDRLE